ncbi:MAG: (Fe-S)-binding protein, partial [Desulfobacterales bacterium]|nr:(Fe-S)-binding protein [Desulfobacterales bacterium]
MQDITELAKLINSLEQELSACARCGICQAVCPIFNITLHEADVARGKLALLSGLAEEMFKNPKKVGELLNRCLLCGSCENTCTRSVNVLEIFFKARVILTRFQDLSGTKKIILRNILSNPERFDRIFLFLAKFQGLFLKKANTQL